MTLFNTPTRRDFLKGTVALGLGGVVAGRPLTVRAETYPERNIDVVVPTREGGGADRNLLNSRVSARDRAGSVARLML